MACWNSALALEFFSEILILRAPPNVIGQRFNQMVRRENLALIVENQRRQADQRQRFGGGTRPLQLEPRRHQRAASKVRPQCVQLLDEGLFHGSAGIAAFYTQSYQIPGWQGNDRYRHPTKSVRAIKVSICRIAIQFFGGENVKFGQEPGVMGLKAAITPLIVGKPRP